MKCSNCARLFGPLAVVLSLIAIPLYGQNLSQKPSQQKRTEDTPGPSQKQTISFLGTVKKSEGKIVIEDPSTSVRYIIDNPETVGQYMDKSVAVTGVLDPTTNTLHIISVRPGGQ